MRNAEQHYSFLFKYGWCIIYLVFLIGLFLNGSVAISYFRNGRWLLGIWALFSILILPKAALGLILIAGHKSIVFLNMPEIIRGIFPRTMQRYRSDSLIYISGNPILIGVVRELIWLGIGLFPIITFLFLQ